MIERYEYPYYGENQRRRAVKDSAVSLIIKKNFQFRPSHCQLEISRME